uniref:Uncharacterized protein n=1 Tax=Cacopsylla melanoneura TaxID=428564 RepID=A0A8D8TF71_9HEMI
MVFRILIFSNLMAVRFYRDGHILTSAYLLFILSCSIVSGLCFLFGLFWVLSNISTLCDLSAVVFLLSPTRLIPLTPSSSHTSKHRSPRKSVFFFFLTELLLN